MGILSWLFGRKPDSDAAGFSEAELDEALEGIVQTANPRLRLLPDYRARLRPAVATALGFARGLVAAIPSIREASATAWTGDPVLRAFFATADDVRRAFSRSNELRALFEQAPEIDEVYAVLGARMKEQSVLGMALQGEVLQRDVPQKTVSFSDHRTRILGRSRGELCAAIERRILDQLALLALERLGEARSLRLRLEGERSLLVSRLRLLQRGGQGLEAALGGRDDDTQQEVSELESRLGENERQLREAGGGPGVLKFELKRVRQVMANPRQGIDIGRRCIRLNSMNVMVEAGGAEPSHEIEFAYARIAGQTAQQLAFTVVRIPRAELLPREQLIREAERFLL